MSDPISEELLRLNQRLLNCIAAADWATYEELCDPTLTAFEPEAVGYLVEGLDFHRFYFNLGGPAGPHRTTMAAPRVRVLGDVAIVTYIRLSQRADPEGGTTTSATEETRVWQKQGGGWRHVHFHRSRPAG